MGDCPSGADSISDIDVNVPCQFQDGQDVIDFYAMDVDNYALDICMIVVIMVVLRTVGLLSLYARTYRKHK